MLTRSQKCFSFRVSWNLELLEFRFCQMKIRNPCQVQYHLSRSWRTKLFWRFSAESFPGQQICNTRASSLRSKRFRGAKSEERDFRHFARAGETPIFALAPFFAWAKCREPRSSLFARRKRLLRRLPSQLHVGSRPTTCHKADFISEQYTTGKF